MDDQGSGVLLWEIFENCMIANKAYLSAPEKEAIKEVYKDPSSQGNQVKINYSRMEKDIGNIFTPYQELVGATQVPKKTPVELLVELVRVISEKQDLQEYARSIDRTNKGYLNRGDIVVSFKEHEAQVPLTEDEFESIYQHLNPTKSPRIYISRFVESLAASAYQLMVEYSGRMLNGYEEKKENPLGYKATQSPTMKRGWLPLDALTEIFQTYDPEMNRHRTDLIITCLELTPNNMAVKYRDFSKAYLNVLQKMRLRPSLQIQQFFSQIPSNQKLFDHVYAEGEEAAKPSPEVFTQIKDEIRQSVKTLKGNLGLLNKDDALEIFERIDTDKSNTINQQEFNTLINSRAPEIPPRIIKEIYMLLDKAKTGNVTRDNFVEVMTKDIPEVHGRVELLIEKTRWASSIYKRIEQKLREKGSPLSEILFANEASTQQLLDCFKHTLELKDPEIALNRLIQPFVQEVKGDKIDVEEFQTIVDEFKPAQSSAPLSHRPEHHVSELDILISQIREKIKREPELSVSLINKHCSGPPKTIISPRELALFLLELIPSITKLQIKNIYRRIDLKGFQLVSKQEVLEFFGMKKAAEDLSILKIATAEGRSREYENILQDIASKIYQKKMSLEDFFEFKTPKANKTYFFKVISFLNIQTHMYSNWDSFMKAIEDKQSTDRVDMTKLKLLFEDYNKGGAGKEPIRPEELKSQTEALLFDLLNIFQNQPSLVSSAFDPDGNSKIELTEFNLFSKQYLNHSKSLDEIKQIYDSLKEPNERELSTMSFKLALHKIIEKYHNIPHVKQIEGFIAAATVPPASGSNVAFQVASSMVGDQATPGAVPVQSTPAQIVPGKENLTAEEKASQDLERMFVKIRRSINYQDDELLNKLKTLDKTETCRLHKAYVLDVLKEMKCELTQEESDLLVSQVIKSEDQLLYLDLISKLFPKKHLVKIRTAHELAEELLKNMKLHRITLKSLWEEAKGQSKDDFINLSQFSTFLKNRNLLIGEDATNAIFKELDVSREMKVSQTEFMNPFLENRQLKKPPVLQLNLKTFLANTLKNTCPQVFNKYKSSTGGLTYPDFVKSFDEIGFPINYLEIEALFDSIDTNKTGTLDVAELDKILDTIVTPTPVSVEKVPFNEEVLRKAIFVKTKKEGMSFEQFFKLIDHENKGYLNLKDFIEMTKWLEFKTLDIDKDIRPMFEKIDSLSSNYQLSCKEFSLFYDEATILFLFPHILDFKIALMKTLAEKKLPVVFFLRKYDLDGDGKLNSTEFKGLANEIGCNPTPEDFKILFDDFDSSNDGNIDPRELRDNLVNGRIDVVELANNIRTTLLRSNYQPSNSFTAAAKTQVDKLSFSEFYSLMTETLSFRLNIIEAEELFDFGTIEDKSFLSKQEFLALFDGFKPVNPFVHNPIYIQSLLPKDKEYYHEKYVLMNKTSKNYQNQDLYDRKKDEMVMSPQKFSFIKKEPELGTQSGNLNIANPAKVGPAVGPGGPVDGSAAGSVAGPAAGLVDKPVAGADAGPAAGSVAGPDAGPVAGPVGVPAASSIGGPPVAPIAPVEKSANDRRIDEMTAHLGDIDKKFVSKIDLWRRDEVEIQNFFQIHTKSGADYISTEELDRMLTDIKAKFTDEEKTKLFANMTPSADRTVRFLEFKKYYDLVHLKYDRTKFNPRVQVMNFQEKLSHYMIYQGQELEEVISTVKPVIEPGLNTQHFLILCQKIGVENMSSTDDSDPLFKAINQRGDSHVIFEDLKDVLVNYEDVKMNIQKMRDESLHRQIKNHSISNGPHNITNYFTSHDLKNEGTVDIQDFKKFFTINMSMKEDSWELKRLSQLFVTPGFSKVNYISFLEKFQIGEAVSIQDMKKHQENLRKQSPLIEFTTYVNRYCSSRKTEPPLLFDMFDKKREGEMTQTDFGDLVREIDIESVYGSKDTEGLFSLLDTNKAGRVTKSEFCKGVMGNWYIEPKVATQESFIDFIKTISEGLERLRKPTLQNYFGVETSTLLTSHFTRGASMIDLPLTDPRYPEFLEAFKDEEKKDQINLNLIQSMIDKYRPVSIPDIPKSVVEQPVAIPTQPSAITNTQKEVRFEIKEPLQGSNTSPAAMPPSASNNLQPGKNRFDGSSVKTPADPSYLYDSYNRGRTPSPDAQINRTDPWGQNSGVSNNMRDNHSMRGSQFSSYMTQPKKFNPEERVLVKKVLANIVNFLEEDRKQPREIFQPYDIRSTGSISSRDLERILYDDMYIERDHNTDLMVDYYSEPNGRILLVPLIMDLEKYKQAKKNNQFFHHSTVREMLKSNQLMTIPKEKLTNYVPPKRTDESQQRRCENRIAELKAFFKYTYGFSNRKLFEFLDVNKDNRIIKKEFFDKTIDSGFTGCSREDLNEVFRYIDSNNNGVISLKEFKHYFYDREFLEHEATHEGTELDDELKLLFRRLDSDQTGFIQCEEFVRCLNLLGYPVTPEMIEVEFKEFDYNKDSRMDFSEFRRFMHAKMRKTMFRMDNTVDEIKRKFKKIHPTDGNLYDYVQFATGISSLAPDIAPEEAEALFFEIDQDREGTVSLDEITEFLKRPADDSETPKISNAILKIKKSQVLPVKDLIDIYEYVPKNFCTAFTRMNYLEMKSLPCESLYPKLLGNTLGYSELYGEYTDPKTGHFYPAKPMPVHYLRHLSLSLATGVPIPEETKLNRNEQIKKREIRAVLFDRQTHKFVGGTLTIPVNWSRSYEDRWEFPNAEKNASFFVRAPSADNSLCIVFEFVMTVVYKKVELQMSCCWTAIDLANLNKPGNQELNLFGGAPNFSTQILNSDVRTGRTTLIGKIGKFFGGNIKSKLNLKLLSTDKLRPSTREALDQLPRTILVPTESLNLWRAFRTYLGRNCNTGEGLNKALPIDVAVKTFCRIVNLPSFNRRVSQLWNSVAEPRFAIKGTQRPNYDKIEDVFEECMNITSPVFDGEYFQYNRTDQTLEKTQEPEMTHRDTLIDGALQRMRNIIEGSLINLENADLKYERAFDIEELLEDEFEAIGGTA